MKLPTAQQAMNNLSAALMHCHVKKISVSPFDVEFILFEIKELSNNPRTGKLSKEAIINRIKHDSIDTRTLEILEYLSDTLMHCHQNNIEIKALKVYGLISDISRLMRGETDFTKLPMIDLERAIYTQLRGNYEI